MLASGRVAGFDPDVETVHDATYAAGQTEFAVDTWARATFEDYAATPHA